MYITSLLLLKILKKNYLKFVNKVVMVRQKLFKYQIILPYSNPDKILFLLEDVFGFEFIICRLTRAQYCEVSCQLANLFSVVKINSRIIFLLPYMGLSSFILTFLFLFF